MIELGRKGRDIVSGFKGIITARVSYLTGCDQYCLSPKAGKDGRIPSGQYFDENRVEVSGKAIQMHPIEKTGDPQRDAPQN